MLYYTCRSLSQKCIKEHENLPFNLKEVMKVYSDYVMRHETFLSSRPSLCQTLTLTSQLLSLGSLAWRTTTVHAAMTTNSTRSGNPLCASLLLTIPSFPSNVRRSPLCPYIVSRDLYPFQLCLLRRLSTTPTLCWW